MPEKGRAARLLTRIRLMPRPTRAASLLITLAVILELLGQIINSRGVTIAAAVALGAVLGDAFLVPHVTFADLDRRTPARMTVGVEASVHFSVLGSSRGKSGRRPIVMVDRAPGLDVGRYVFPSIVRGERAVVERIAMPLHRGCWLDGGRVEIEAHSPLGGWVRRNRVRLAESGWIHPAPATPLRLPESLAGDIFGRTSSARSGSGHDFYGIREWRAGDPATSVHWRASARRNQLVVVERERPGHPTVLILAGRLIDNQVAEDLLARVAATALQALRDGRNVVLAATGSVLTASKPIDALDWFAGLDPDTDPDADTVRNAMQLAGAGANVVWLGVTQLPADVVAAARAAGAGSVTAASQLAGLRR